MLWQKEERSGALNSSNFLVSTIKECNLSVQMTRLLQLRLRELISDLIQGSSSLIKCLLTRKLTRKLMTSSHSVDGHLQ